MTASIRSALRPLTLLALLALAALPLQGAQERPAPDLTWVARSTRVWDGWSTSTHVLADAARVVVASQVWGWFDDDVEPFWALEARDPAGRLLWDWTTPPAYWSRSQPSGLVRSGGEAVVVAGHEDFDVVAYQVRAPGVLDWSLEVTTSGTPFGAIGLVEHPAGGVVLAGSTQRRRGRIFTQHPWVARVSETGALLWSRVFPGVDGEGELRTVAVSPAGVIVAAGNTVADVDGYVLVLNGDGEVTGSHVIEAEPPAWNGFSTAAVTPDGSFTLAGWASVFPGQRVAVTRLTPAGELAWTREFATPGGVEGPASLVHHADGRMVVAVTAQDVVSGASVLALCLDAQGALLWSYRRRGFFLGPARLGQAMAGEAGETWLAGGQEGVDPSDAFFIALDAAGKPLWERRYDGKLFLGDAAAAMARADDGRVYAAGHTTDYLGRTGVVWAFDPIRSPPPSPAGLRLEVLTETSVRLEWTDGPRETEYTIERQVPGQPYAPLGTAGRDSTTFTDAGLTPESEVAYRLIAANSFGRSDPSAEAAVRLPSRAPGKLAAPRSLSLGVVRTGRERTVVLTVRNTDRRSALWVSSSGLALDTLTSPALPPTLLAPATVLELPIRFAPTRPGRVAGELRLRSGDPRRRTAVVRITGVGR